MIVNEYAFEMLQREREAQLAIELERRRVQLERAEETSGSARPRRVRWFLFRAGAAGRQPMAERHAH
jgi:hypothetical protein